MNVALIDLDRRHHLFKVPLWWPVYLPSVAAVLRESGHAVALIERGVLEARSHDNADEVLRRLVARVVSAEPELVLFDVRADSASDLNAFAEAARRGAPRARLLAGGRHPTLCPDETLEDCGFLDGIVAGEAENAMSRLAAGAALDAVPSVVFRQAGQAARTAGEAPVTDLDTLPLPAWDLLDMRYYARRTPRAIPCFPLKTATLETSRGCPGQCTFCSEGRMNSKAHRFHGAAYVAEAIQLLIRDYGIDGAYFCDESFLANPGRVMQLCEELMRQGLDRKIRWSAQVRTDSVNPEILAVLRKAGCVQLEYGVESGSQRMLDSVAKGATMEQNAAAVRLGREAGVRALVYIMYGLPGETRDDLRETARFLGRTRPDIVRFIRFMPFPGTPAAQQLVAAGRLPRDFWREARGGRSFFEYTRENVSAMPAEVLRTEARSVYFRRVFPVYLRDYLRRNSPADILSHMQAAELLRFLREKMVAPRE
ncbi:MAG: radical SAM protein [Verrucomicrobiota bacterium]